jgi:hypothetical protein
MSTLARSAYLGTDPLSVYKDFNVFGEDAYWIVDCDGEHYFESAAALEKELEDRADVVFLPWGDQISFKAAVALMDDEIREQVHAEKAPCFPQDFLDRYCELHEEKYGEEFTV